MNNNTTPPTTTDLYPDVLSQEEAMAYRSAAIRAHAVAEAMAHSTNRTTVLMGRQLLLLIEEAAPNVAYLGR